jgi:hypothetical protein
MVKSILKSKGDKYMYRQTAAKFMPLITKHLFISYTISKVPKTIGRKATETKYKSKIINILLNF